MNKIENTFINFLINAKKETYANSTVEKVKSSRLGSKDYHYERNIEGNKYIYHDTQDNVLRPALIKVGEDKNVIPVRGHENYENNGYTYIFKAKGTMENFDGIEQIYKEDILIYELHCSGGIIE